MHVPLTTLVGGTLALSAAVSALPAAAPERRSDIANTCWFTAVGDEAGMCADNDESPDPNPTLPRRRRGDAFQYGHNDENPGPILPRQGPGNGVMSCSMPDGSLCPDDDNSPPQQTCSDLDGNPCPDGGFDSGCQSSEGDCDDGWDHQQDGGNGNGPPVPRRARRDDVPPMRPHVADSGCAAGDDDAACSGEQSQFKARDDIPPMRPHVADSGCAAGDDDAACSGEQQKVKARDDIPPMHPHISDTGCEFGRDAEACSSEQPQAKAREVARRDQPQVEARDSGCTPPDVDGLSRCWGDGPAPTPDNDGTVQNEKVKARRLRPPPTPPGGRTVDGFEHKKARAVVSPAEGVAQEQPQVKPRGVVCTEPDSEGRGQCWSDSQGLNLADGSTDDDPFGQSDKKARALISPEDSGETRQQRRRTGVSATAGASGRRRATAADAGSSQRLGLARRRQGGPFGCGGEAGISPLACEGRSGGADGEDPAVAEKSRRFTISADPENGDEPMHVPILPRLSDVLPTTLQDCLRLGWSEKSCKSRFSEADDTPVNERSVLGRRDDGVGDDGQGDDAYQKCIDDGLPQLECWSTYGRRR